MQYMVRLRIIVLFPNLSLPIRGLKEGAEPAYTSTPTPRSESLHDRPLGYWMTQMLSRIVTFSETRKSPGHTNPQIPLRCLYRHPLAWPMPRPGLALDSDEFDPME
jgi:hypothetical protein